MKKLTITFAVSALLLGACATSGLGPVSSRDGMLVAASGMTLYTFDKDEANSGKSVCNGKCAENWPPLLVQEGEQAPTDFSVVLRDDGKRQWAFKGKPLYFWAKDQKPGDKSGDGVNGVWKIAR